MPKLRASTKSPRFLNRLGAAWQVLRGYSPAWDLRYLRIYQEGAATVLDFKRTVTYISLGEGAARTLAQEILWHLERQRKAKDESDTGRS